MTANDLLLIIEHVDEQYGGRSRIANAINKELMTTALRLEQQ